MSYPYTALSGLLQFRTSSAEYTQITAAYLSPKLGTLRPTLGPDYWALLPVYVYTQCPICGVPRQEMVDTYSLLGWSGLSKELSKSIYVLSRQPTPGFSCPHFMTYHCFLHLHGHLPVEVLSFANYTGEVPLITEWALPDDIESYVVLHALPICRMEVDHFVPSYTLFILSYFNQDPTLVVHRHFAAEWQRGAGDREFYPGVLSPPSLDRDVNEFYALQPWATQGKLGYLDFTQTDLPLQIGPGTQLPAIYQDIQGLRSAYNWHNGEITAWIKGRHTVLRSIR